MAPAPVEAPAGATMPIVFLRDGRFGVFTAAALLATTLTLFGHANSASAADAVPPVRLFGSSEQGSPNLSQFPKWTGVLERYAHERPLEGLPCSGGSCAVQRWKRFLGGLEGKSALQQLESVNRYVNQTIYRTDMARYGVVDHWATPVEFFGRSGDCEDYAIAKYLSLRNLGWEKKDLRILVLNDEVRRELHAVLIAYHGGTAYVLDNLTTDLLEHAAIRHYTPIFSINETTWYFHQHWNPPAPTLVASTVFPSTLPGDTASPPPVQPLSGDAPVREDRAEGEPRESFAAAPAGVNDRVTQEALAVLADRQYYAR